MLALCERWEIRASVVGRVTDTGRFRVYDGLLRRDRRAGREPAPAASATTRPRSRRTASPIADVPIGSLGDGPLYHRPLAPPADLDDAPGRRSRRPSCCARFPPGTDLSTELLDLLASPNIADTSWVWRQYDHQLFLNTVAGPGGDASVLRLKETAGRALALSVDGKGRFCALDPRVGAQLAVLEAARNVACSGAAPDGARQLPELRQPRAPRGDVAVLRGRRRDGARRAARSACRSSAATSASTTSRTASTSTRRRSSA